MGECKQGTEYSSDNVTIFVFFFKSIGIIILNYLILIVVIICFCEITQSLLIINKSLEFELFYMKLTTLKVNLESDHETCFR